MPESRESVIDIGSIQESLGARLWAGDPATLKSVTGVYASDLMSDVLAYGKPGSVLLTGLNSVQTAISAYMADFRSIVFLRNKIPENETLQFAKEKGLVIFSSGLDMYEACVMIAGIEGRPSNVTESEQPGKARNITTHSFEIDGQDFANAGMMSTQIKAILKSIGYDPQLIRRVAIATYEAEMNVVMHARRAEVTMTASDKEIYIIIIDEGKGIKDIELAMQEGYSTATEEQRALGFGAGMGLPNIKKNADEMILNSVINQGTRIETIFYVK